MCRGKGSPVWGSQNTADLRYDLVCKVPFREGQEVRFPDTEKAYAKSQTGGIKKYSGNKGHEKGKE